MATPQSLFRDAMGRFSAAVTVITAGAPGNRLGLTATAVCSLSDDPPSLVACVNKQAAAHALILDSGCFGVALLGAEHATVAERFAGRFGTRGEARFEGLNWITGATGAPLLGDALAAYDCRLHQAVDGFTHTIFIGLIELIRLGDRPGACLMWRERRFHTVTELPEPWAAVG